MDADYYDTREFDGLCHMDDTNIDRFSECIAQAFEGYPAFGFIHGHVLDAERMKPFWKMILKTNRAHALCIASDPEVNSLLIAIKPGTKNASITSYILNGGLSVEFRVGVKNIRSILKVVDYSDRIKSRFMTDNSWYLFIFTTRPHMQGRNLGSKLLKQFLAFLDANGQDCYLETLLEKNVRLYNHFGFDLVNVAEMSEMDVKIYSMSRIAGTPLR